MYIQSIIEKCGVCNVVFDRSHKTATPEVAIGLCDNCVGSLADKSLIGRFIAEKVIFTTEIGVNEEITVKATLDGEVIYQVVVYK